MPSCRGLSAAIVWLALGEWAVTLWLVRRAASRSGWPSVGPSRARSGMVGGGRTRESGVRPVGDRRPGAVSLGRGAARVRGRLLATDRRLPRPSSLRSGRRPIRRSSGRWRLTIVLAWCRYERDRRALFLPLPRRRRVDCPCRRCSCSPRPSPATRRWRRRCGSSPSPSTSASSSWPYRSRSS